MQIVKTELLTWEGLYFTLYMTVEPGSDQLQRLVALIQAWYTVGFYTGYGGKFHHLSKFESVADEGEYHIEWWVDMGTAESKVVDTFVRCLDQFAIDNRLHFTKLILGAQYVC